MAGLMIDIDGSALKKELLQRDLTYQEVSVELGYDPSYTSRVIKRNKATKAFLSGLKLRYNIETEKVMPKAPEKEAQPEQMALNLDDQSGEALDYGHLKSIIYEAVYEAVKKAWAE